MSLTEYKRKRHFDRTSEPSGSKAKKSGWSFVVQKHAASRLHYDFRLELDGVLKSWAVPKGPSLDPSQKRLALQVEDHPIEYGSFEGIIPEGEYGGGTVMLWDRGEWKPEGDANEGYRRGKLKFQLQGEKLRGGWFLVRRSGSSGSGSEKVAWFLIKEHDAEAKSLENGDVVQEMPLSVASGRDLEEIGAAKDRTWTSQRKSRTRKSANAKPRRQRSVPRAIDLAGVPSAALPRKLGFQLATLTKAAPEGDLWLHEIKFDGYRMACRIENGRVDFISRNNQDWTSRLKGLASAATELPVKQALLDGEVVALMPDGRTDFQLLQNAFRGDRQQLVYFAFDLLHLEGHDLTGLPLEERKRILGRLLSPGESGAIRFSEHVAGSGPQFHKNACRMGLEGIVSKRRDGVFGAGRSYDWLKVKCMQNDEFVIGGYTNPSGARTGFGALLLGYHNGDEKLTYAGKVGTGFDDRTLEDLVKRLKALERSESPFADLRGSSGPARGAHWVEPALVAQVAFGSWTDEKMLRHPSFQGLREDKPAKEVKRDAPVPVEEAVQESKASRRAVPRNAKSKRTAAPVKVARAKKPKRSRAPLAPHGQDEFAGVRLTSPDKLMYSEEGVTKLDLAAYYYEIADWILPHVAGRPLVLVRCPEGSDKECFYQKHPRMGTPKNLRQIPVREKSKTEMYVVVDDMPGLISLVQIGALEIHAWGSRADDIERPDRLIFDLDPNPDVPWPRVVASARQIRQFLEVIGLQCFVKTTGGKGLHIVVPIQRRHDWDEAKQFCKSVAETIVAADPDNYTSNMSKAARTGKIFIDYLRNGRGATSVAAYSTRAKSGAPVSVPLSWKELVPAIRSDQFNTTNLPKRLASLKRDPWDGIDEVRQSITAGVKKKLRR